MVVIEATAAAPDRTPLGARAVVVVTATPAQAETAWTRDGGAPRADSRVSLME